jgi:hypothetical protein
VLPGSALLALRWAAKTGQLQTLQKGALLIFDEEEPVGKVTDHFPSQPEIAPANAPPSQGPSQP